MRRIISERSGSILRVALNRPAKKNAMTSSINSSELIGKTCRRVAGLQETHEAVSARANRAGHASRARGVCLAGAFVGGKGSVYGIPREASAGLHENREPGPHLGES